MKEIDESNVDIEEIVLYRIEQILDEKHVKKSDYAELLNWSTPRLSKILKRNQKITLTDLQEMTKALGYPIEAFTGEVFDLEQYELNTAPIPLMDSISNINRKFYDMEAFKKAVNQDIPLTIRRYLNINSAQFIFHSDINEICNPFIDIEQNEKSAYSYRPEIVLRFKGIESKNNDFIELGYWFDEGNNYMVLAICYVPDSTNRFSSYGKNKRAYYRSLVEAPENHEFDALFHNSTIFTKRILAGEIYSKLYNLNTSKIDEEILKNDLIWMFDIYKKLIIEVGNNIDTTYWEIYNQIQKESGKIIPLTPNDIVSYMTKSITYETRSKIVAKEAMEKANYRCEIDPSHETFIGKDGTPYMEAHHLIPLAYRKQGFEYDTLSNSVCLCPMCHKKIHMAEDSVREEMIVKLYYQRKQDLDKDQINVSLAKLLEMYNLK